MVELPEIGVGVLAFGITVGAGVLIDRGAAFVKSAYYRRN
jgi:hypothetical protein